VATVAAKETQRRQAERRMDEDGGKLKSEGKSQ